MSAAQLANRWAECSVGYREVFVAMVDGRPVGTVSVGGQRHREDGGLRLFALDVGPNDRRQGIDTAVIPAVETEARRRGLGHVHLEVVLENERAIRLYDLLGDVRGAEIVSAWWSIGDDGSRTQVQEQSYVTSKTVD